MENNFTCTLRVTTLDLLRAGESPNERETRPAQTRHKEECFRRRQAIVTREQAAAAQKFWLVSLNTKPLKAAVYLVGSQERHVAAAFLDKLRTLTPHKPRQFRQSCNRRLCAQRGIRTRQRMPRKKSGERRSPSRRRHWPAWTRGWNPSRHKRK